MVVGLAAIDFVPGALWWGWTHIPRHFEQNHSSLGAKE